jgi:hypothetical protein
MNVTLELIDAASGAVLATDETPLHALPERFEGVETHLTIGEAQYRVVAADPHTRALIAEAGRVRLLLARVVETDPRAVRFSVPTLEDQTPALDGPVPDGAIALHEDDWRQTEFVSAAFAEAVREEIEAVRAVKAVHEPGRGWEHLHVRRRIPAPLEDVSLTLHEVVEALGMDPRPLATRGGGAVRDGFALPQGDALVYGVAPHGRVTALGIQGIPDDVVGQLHALALRHKLLLVEWCVPRVVRAHEAGFVV